MFSTKPANPNSIELIPSACIWFRQKGFPMAKQTKRRDSRGRILEKGEGQRRDGRYYFEWTDATGARHYVYANSLTELRRKKNSVTVDIVSGVIHEGNSLTLNEALEYWKDSRLADIAIGALKPTTINQYLNAYDKHVRDSLGNLKIKDITKSKLENFYKRKMASGLGISVLTNIAKPINQTLAIAEDEGWIRKNPTKGALRAVNLAEKKKRTREGSYSVKALTEEQQVLLVRWLEKQPERKPLALIVKTLLFTGLRIGELAGLQHSDIEEGYLSVRHSYAYFGLRSKSGKKMVRVMQEPKSYAGNRVIPLLEPARKSIEEYIRWVEESRITLASPIDGYSDFVFLTRKGWPLSPSGVNVSLKRAVNAINKEQTEKGEQLLLPHISCHWLRRTFATRLCEAGVSLKVAQYVLGHADASLTLMVYQAAHTDFTTAEMMKLIDAGKSTPLSSVQQIYNKFAV